MCLLLLIPIILIIPVLCYSAIGLAEYAKYNNTEPSFENHYTEPENTWDSVEDEYQELLEAINEWKIWDSIMEFYDVLNALMKHYIITYLPVCIYTQPYIWFLTSLIVFPVGFKLGCRYISYGCIRNHKTTRDGKAKNHTCQHSNSKKLKIYYSCSVRGGAKADAAETIRIMKKYTDVLTEHLAKDGPDEDFADSDTEIFKKDIKLLGECDIMIADVSNASLGVGFMIQTALRMGKPVHCFNSKDSLSAMIAGCPDVTVYPMDDSFESRFMEIIGHYHNEHNIRYPVNYPNVVIIGPAGSGKSTVGRKLADMYDKVYISTGELLRQLTDKHPHYKTVQELMNAGKMIPADIMSAILKEKLETPNVVINGFVIDGYPQSFDDYNAFHNIYRISDIGVVFKFECDRDTCVKRQCNRGTRTSDNEETAQKRFNIYIENVPNSVQMMRFSQWFPSNLIIPIDATLTPEQVWNNVLTSYRNLDYQNVPKDRSYMLMTPIRPRNTSRFHFHIDGESHNSVHQMVLELFRKQPEQINDVKIYPIGQLSLGKQASVDPAYQSMMNFHSIGNDDEEAFVTGCLRVPTRFSQINTDGENEYNETHGSQSDHSFMRKLYAVLDTALEHHVEFNENTMVELEEYIAEYKLPADGSSMTIVYEYIPYDSPFLKEMNAVHTPHYNKNTPPLEFHHGFDIEKTSEQPPFTLEDLNEFSKNNEINNGGWFIFKNDKYWKFRSNEFVRPNRFDYLNLNDLKRMKKQYEELSDKLLCQTKTLDLFLNSKSFKVDITSSIEIVHGIWNFNH